MTTPPDLHDEILVHDALHRATDELTAPVPTLTANATYRGRRLRRRRRAVAAAGSLAAAAVVVVPVGLSLGGTSEPGTVATEPPPATASPTPTAEPTPGMVDNDAWARMPAAEMAATFEDLAPEGIALTDVRLTNEDAAPGEPTTKSPGYLLARVTTDGVVTGSVNLILEVTGQSVDRYTCPGNLSHPDSCTPILGDDGQPIGRRSVTTSGDVVEHEVVLLRENGGLVYVDVTNSTDDKWGQGSAVAGPDAPLTLDQLQAIAEDDAWISWKARG